MIARRNVLAGGVALSLASIGTPTIAFARAATDKRLLFVIQRGAADGLSLLAPVGDPQFTTLRGKFLPDYAEAKRLGSFFALHPALAEVGTLADAGQARFVHAVASSYRARSHFDGQNLLESGGLRAYERRDGWLNRLVGLLPDGEVRALALSQTVPLALQGPETTASYAPSALPEAQGDLLTRVTGLYAEDPQLLELWQEALLTREMAGDSGVRSIRNAEQAGRVAASLMKGANGARIMMVESDGWDTHASQRGQIARSIGNLDAMLGAFRKGLGGDWNDTLVIVATEFGRTAAINGTGGTDHGTASLAMVLGGRLGKSGVVGDWPGLSPNQLYEGRDLRPTTALERVIAGATAEHFGLEPKPTLASLFPGRS